MKPNRREAISLLAGAAPIAVGMLFAAGVTNNALAPVTKPNILFMLSDNVGYGVLSSYNGGILDTPTPRIERV